MTAETKRKAVRLLVGGRVKPDPGPVEVYRVEGDHDTYTVVVGAHVALCTCPARAGCSHLEAARVWALARAEALRVLAGRGDPHPDDADGEALFARLAS